MSSATPPPANGNAPTEPLAPPTAPLNPQQRRRQQLVQGSQRGQHPRWQGRPHSYRGQAQRPAGPAFRGQQPGEMAIFVRRKHPIFLILPAWPAVLALLGLLVLFLLHTGNARLGALFFILETVFGVIFFIFLVKWLIADLNDWLFDIYVLTDRRLIDASGFFSPTRKEATLDRIQQVQVDRNNLFEYLLDFGNVVIVTAGAQGDLTLDGIAHPRELADQIREAEQAYRSGSRAPAPPIEPHNPAVKAVLDEVAKPVVLTPPPSAPNRTFGGFLRRPAMIRFLDGEVVVDYIYRHPFVLVRREVPPAAVLLGSLLLSGALTAFLHVPLWWVPLLGVLVGLVYGVLVYLNYADDVFILTTHRIIDIDRFVFFFYEGRKQADYTKVQDVRVAVDTVVGRLLNYGNIVVETAGRLPNIEMSDIPDPFAVQDKIFNRINAVKERDAAAAANRQRLENRRLIAATMNKLLVDVPEVRNLSVLEAGQRLADAGLRLVVESERRMPGVPPGVVVAQMPSHGANALYASEVYVVLSGRA